MTRLTQTNSLQLNHVWIRNTNLFTLEINDQKEKTIKTIHSDQDVSHKHYSVQSEFLLLQFTVVSRTLSYEKYRANISMLEKVIREKFNTKWNKHTQVKEKESAQNGSKMYPSRTIQAAGYYFICYVNTLPPKRWVKEGHPGSTNVPKLLTNAISFFIFIFFWKYMFNQNLPVSFSSFRIPA